MGGTSSAMRDYENQYDETTTPLVSATSLDSTPGDPIFPSSQGFHRRRACRDRPWAFLFLLYFLAVVGTGFIFVGKTNKTDFKKYIHYHLDNQINCFQEFDIPSPFLVSNGSLAGSQAAAAAAAAAAGDGSAGYGEEEEDGRDLYLAYGDPSATEEQIDEETEKDRDKQVFIRRISVWMTISAAVSLLVGTLSLNIFRKYPTMMAYSAVGLTMAIPLGVAIAGGIVGTMPLVYLGGAFFLLIAVLTIGLGRERIRLCAEIFKVASAGLQSNMSIVVYNVLIQLFYLGLLAGMLAQIFTAVTNGHVEANPHLDTSYGSKDQYCYVDGHKGDDDYNDIGSSDGNRGGGGLGLISYKMAPCCIWAFDKGVLSWVAVAVILISWTSFLIFQLRIFVTSGTIGHWYYHDENSTTTSNSSVSNYMMKMAFSQQAGTLVLGALILALTDMLRRLLRRGPNRRSNSACFFLAALTQCILDYLDFLTRFTTIYAAIKGEAFCQSAREMHKIFTNHTLNTIGIWWIPSFVVGICTFLLAILWGVSVYLFSFLAYQHHNHLTSHWGDSLIFAVVSFLIAMVVIGFFTGLVLVAVDSVYVCYSFDLEAREATRAGVHQVYNGITGKQPIESVLVVSNTVTEGQPLRPPVSAQRMQRDEEEFLPYSK